MPLYIATGVSGSGRIELLQELGSEIEARGHRAMVHDVGQKIREAAQRQRIHLRDEKVLDLDASVLRLLRALVLDKVRADVIQAPKVFHLVGLHATFLWKDRLIPGVAYSNLLDFESIDGFMNVVDDVANIYSVNQRNPKWRDSPLPDLAQTNVWMMEEEFITEVLADIFEAPMWIVARHHDISNLADLLLTSKPKMYLSYPITAIKDEDPELLERVRQEIRPKLEELFVVFDPLAIGDMALASRESYEIEGTVTEISPQAARLLGVRTVERDFQFIDQSDFIIVVYLTEKVSPGVMNEMTYAHRNSKDVYAVYPYARSPFLQEVSTGIFSTLEDLIDHVSRSEFSARY